MLQRDNAKRRKKKRKKVEEKKRKKKEREKENREYKTAYTTTHVTCGAEGKMIVKMVSQGKALTQKDLYGPTGVLIDRST